MRAACDSCLYVLLEGEVEVIKAYGEPGERLLGRRGAGTIFGEMSMFSAKGGHTASVRSATPLRLVKVKRRQFVELLKRYPGLTIELARLLSKRLEESENATIEDLLVKNRELADAYNELREAQAQIIEKEKLEHELALARRIQEDILPHQLPEAAGIDFGALMVAARAVGGDFFDIIQLDPHRIAVAVGDVSDKGMPAALFMSLTFSLLKVEASRHKEPQSVLLAVNKHLAAMDISNMFVTVLFGVLDTDRMSFTYARAGHPSPILIGADGGALILPTMLGQPLAIFDEPVLDGGELIIPKGGGLLLYSDGLSELVNPAGEDFYEVGLLPAIQTLSLLGAQPFCDQLYRKLEEFTGSSPAQDDVTLVCIKNITT